MDRDALPLKSLNVFAAVARSNRYSDAAEDLGVTPSAISQQIRVLESWIGGTLFDRATKKPVLTEIGQRLFDGVSPSLVRITDTCTAMRRASDQNTLVVSAPAAYVSFRLIPALTGFWANNPNVEVDIRLAPSFDAPVESDLIDLAIRFLHDHDTACPIGERGWRAVCSPQYFDELGRLERIEDLATGILLHEDIYNFWPEAFADAGMAIPGKINFRGLGDANQVLTAVLAGGGIALLPSELTIRLGFDGLLVSPFRVGIEPEAGYFALHDQTSAKGAVSLLVDHLDTLR